jgi:hypothetical protein
VALKTTLSPEVRPVVVHLPERLVPRAFLELAPSVAFISHSPTTIIRALFNFCIFRITVEHTPCQLFFESDYSIKK